MSRLIHERPYRGSEGEGAEEACIEEHDGGAEIDGRIVEVICSKQHQHWPRHKVVDGKTVPYDQNYNN